MDNRLQQFSKEEKLKAAYALNMCMVSVSQIIDYDDLYVLEQEYDAILNNLNLEQMPKDEAFLDILKQLLDTITFFRIQEGDKKMLEKEYQHKVKNAIWSAVSNIPIFVMSGNPVQMAISIATTIGTGYMNYRREKADIALQNEKQEWQLQRSAMEQFNGLRRELFNTAWQISAQYQFPDEYRLTEKQISQYNEILMDNNYLRRYDRLATIQSKFQAYPAFWYFFGNTAAYISQDKSFSEITRESYKQKAVAHFKTYFETNCYNLLREDQITASCALEYIDLLDTKKDLTKVKELLLIAEKMSGNENDILQLCAIGYLKIDDYSNAMRVMRILVNEGFNTEMNAQLLSKLYVSEYIQNQNQQIMIDYELLKSRTKNIILMPMPLRNESLSELDHSFLTNERTMLKNKFCFVLGALITSYTVLYNKLADPFEGIYPDKYYSDVSQSLKSKRIDETLKVFENRVKAKKYNALLAEKSISFEILNLVNEFLNDLFEFDFIDDINKQIIIDSIKNNINQHAQSIAAIENKIINRTFSVNDYLSLQNISFESFIENATASIIQSLEKYLNSLKDMHALNLFDVAVEQFRQQHHISEIVYIEENHTTEEYSPYIDFSVFGEKAEAEYLKRSNFNKMKQYIIDVSSEVICENTNDTKFLIHGTDEYRNYCLSNSKMKQIEKDTFAIFDVEGAKDLAFTTNGVVEIASNRLTDYSDVECSENQLRLNGKRYNAGEIDCISFEELCQTLSFYAHEIKSFGIAESTDDVTDKLTSQLKGTAATGIPGIDENQIINNIESNKDDNANLPEIAENEKKHRNSVFESVSDIANNVIKSSTVTNAANFVEKTIKNGFLQKNQKNTDEKEE